MLERLVISLLLITIGTGAYLAFKQWHMRHASRPGVLSRPGLLYFRSDQCAPCLTQARLLQPLEAHFQNQIAIRKIDADTEADTAAQYGVFTLPTTLIVDGTGTVKHANYGLTDARKLKRQLESVLS